MPGGGGRRVRAGARRLPRRRAQHPRARPAKPIREDPRVPRRRPRPLRVARDREVHPPQVQDAGLAGPAGRERRRRGGGDGGRVDGGGGAAVPPGHLARGVRVHHLPRHARRRHGPEGRRREPGEAEGGAGDVRGAPVGEQVPGGELLQLRGPQPPPLHLLLHGHPVRGPLRRVPQGEGLVGGPHGQALGQEGLRQYAHQVLVPSRCVIVCVCVEVNLLWNKLMNECYVLIMPNRFRFGKLLLGKQWRSLTRIHGGASRVCSGELQQRATPGFDLLSPCLAVLCTSAVL